MKSTAGHREGAGVDMGPTPRSDRCMTPEARRTWWEIAAVLCIGCAPDIYHSAMVAIDGKIPTETFVQQVGFLVVRATWVVVPVWFLMHHGPLPPRDFGLVRPRWEDVLIGALGCIGYLAAHHVAWFFVRHLPAGATSFTFVGPATPAEFGLLLVGAAANGCAEELVVRAYLITRLRPLLGTGPAVLVAAIVFASYHAYQGLHAMLLVAAGGLVLGVLFVATRRLAPVAIAHAALDVQGYLAAG